LGSAIAVIQVAVPREVILSLGAGPVTSIVGMMLLGAGFDLFDRGLILCPVFCLDIYQGSLLAFLVFGPMIDLKALV